MEVKYTSKVEHPSNCQGQGVVFYGQICIEFQIPNFTLNASSSIGPPSSICGKAGERILHSAWIRLKSEETRSMLLSIPSFSRFGGVCSMLINGPPAGCGKAFRRDGYRVFRDKPEGKFSKNELGRPIIKACRFRRRIGNRAYFTAFRSGLLFLTEKVV